MTARTLLAVALVSLFTGIGSLPVIKPTDKVCQSLSTSCEDLFVASSCKVVKSCISEVWAKLDVPLDNSNVCNICKEMVKEARDQLLSNETQEELREVLEGSCKLVPIEVFADMCIKLVDEFIPDLIDILVSRMDPDQVCTIAGLCNADFYRMMTLQQKLIMSTLQSRIALSPLMNPVQPPRIEECPRCLKSLRPAKAIIKLLPEAQVELLALKICSDHQKDNLTECPVIVKKYFTPVYDYFYETAVNQICVDIQRCPPNDTLKRNVPLVKASDDLPCDFCKQLVGSLRDFLEANTTKDELKQAILAVCEEFGPAAEECQNLLDEYFDMIYAFLLEAVDPERFCSTLGLCPTSTLRVPLVKIFPAIPTTKAHLRKTVYPKKAGGADSPKVTPLVKLTPGIPVKYVKKDDPNIECKLCMFLVKYLDAAVEDKKNEEDIKHALEEACKLVPQHLHDRCVHMVDEYVDAIVQIVVNDGDPATVCGLLGLCNGVMFTTPVKSHVAVEPEKAKLGDVECEICKAVIEFFEENLPEVVTKDVVEYVLDELCNQFSGDKVQECKDLVGKNIDLILKYLTGEVAATAICKLANLCEAGEIVTKPELQKSLKDDNPVCVLCEYVVQFVYSELKDQKTEEEIKQELDMVCDLAPESSKKECLNMVNTYFELVVSLILQEFTPEQVCQTLSLCTSSGKVVTKPELQKSLKGDNPVCLLCKDVVQFVYNELKEQKTEEEIKQELDKVCSLVPKSSKAECLNMVSTYFDLLVSLIMQELTPEQACEALSLCTSSRKVIVPQVTSSNESPDCVLCKDIIQVVYDQLKDVRTEEAVRQVLDKVCSLVPPSGRQECLNIVNEYFEVLVTLILQDLTPDQVCTSLGFCRAPEKTPLHPISVEKPVHVATKQEKSPKDDNPTCTLCKDVVQFVYAELKDNRTEQEIKDVLDEVCNWVPQSSKQECLNMISTYFDLLVSLILQDFTPEQVCQTLNLCPSSSRGDVVCTFCEYALHFIQNELMDHRTEENIQNALNDLCAKIPGDLSKECQAFVEEYGAALIVLLAQELDPSIICVAVRACPKGGLVKQSAVMQNVHLDRCDTCALVIGHVERMVKGKKTDDELAQIFEGVCRSVPAGAKQECQSLIKAYGPLILRNVSELGDSRQVCQAVDICPKSTKHAHLLGSKKCTYGPSYWCHSEAHASACNAHEYCRKKVWKQ